MSLKNLVSSDYKPNEYLKNWSNTSNLPQYSQIRLVRVLSSCKNASLLNKYRNIIIIETKNPVEKTMVTYFC